MENLIETIEHETLPALEIICKSLGAIDDTNGQRVLLQGVIDRLRGQYGKALVTIEP